MVGSLVGFKVGRFFGLREGRKVGAILGSSVGISVLVAVGILLVGFRDGRFTCEGSDVDGGVGELEGIAVLVIEGRELGLVDGRLGLGLEVGNAVGDDEGTGVGALLTDGFHVGIIVDGLYVGIIDDGLKVGIIDDGLKVGIVDDGLKVGIKVGLFERGFDVGD